MAALSGLRQPNPNQSAFSALSSIGSGIIAVANCSGVVNTSADDAASTPETQNRESLLVQLLRRPQGPDRITLLACRRQGIDHRDLIPPQQPDTPSPAPAGALLSPRCGEGRRLAKLRLISAERRAIQRALLGDEDRSAGREFLLLAAENKRLQPHELNLDDLSQDTPASPRSVPDAASAPGELDEETAARRAARAELRMALHRLLGRTTAPLGKSGLTSSSMSADAERFRKRGLLIATRERARELLKAELSAQQRDRDEAQRLRDLDRARQRKRQARRAQRARQQRIGAVQLALSREEEERMKLQAAHEAARIAQERQREAELRLLCERRAKAAQERAAAFAARSRAVAASRQAHTAAKRLELDTKMDLHGARKEFYDLLRLRQSEERRVGRLERLCDVGERRQQASASDEEWRKAVLQSEKMRIASCAKRRLRDHRSRGVAIRRERSEAQGRAERSRLLQDIGWEESLRKLLSDRVAREGELERHGEEKRRRHSEHIARRVERIEAAQDNQRRLDARREFAAALALADIAAGEIQKEADDRRRQAERVQREAEAQRVRAEKRRIQQEVEAIRRAPLPVRSPLTPGPPAASTATGEGTSAEGEATTSASPVMLPRPNTAAAGAPTTRRRPRPRVPSAPPAASPSAPAPPPAPPGGTATLNGAVTELFTAIAYKSGIGTPAADDDASEGSAGSGGGGGEKAAYVGGPTVWDPVKVYGPYCAPLHRRPVRSAPLHRGDPPTGAAAAEGDPGAMFFP
eukprot:TRINITY_DN22099_c0_g1_i1.p1 TRINITY_DN22099_c0_g1~~TRINITY_DN22099_c0_g1_i1.p1  ORF type:complete len:783 (+),score=231.65 TRINITY_DN22099_c0_g1_i1:85-2349(+)